MMIGETTESRRPGCWLAGLLGLIACVAAADRTALAEDAPGGATTLATDSSAAGPVPTAGLPAPGTSTGTAASGLTIFIDPQSGAIRSTPAPGTVPLEIPPQQRATFSTSAAGLVEVPSPVPGGGVSVDLQGRFQSPLIVTVTPDGKPKVQHLGAPHEHEKK